MEVFPKYREASFSEDFAGYPKVCLANRDTAIIAAWIGNLFSFNLKSMRVENQIYVGMPRPLLGACGILQSPCVEPVNAQSCAVATCGGYGVLWNIGDTDFRKIFLVKGGPVNCVAYSPCGNYLLLGIGYYPLCEEVQRRGHEEARIESWSISNDEPKYVTSVTLPGVCVDSLIWDSDDDEILCVTGMRSQNRGFVIRLTTDSLHPISFLEIPFAFSLSAECFYTLGGGQHVVIVHSGGLYEFYIEGKERTWEVTFNEKLYSVNFDPDRRELIFSNGAVLNADKGCKIKQLPPLARCTSLVHRLGGGYVGVSRDGVLRCWE